MSNELFLFSTILILFHKWYENYSNQDENRQNHINFVFYGIFSTHTLDTLRCQLYSKSKVKYFCSSPGLLIISSSCSILWFSVEHNHITAYTYFQQIFTGWITHFIVATKIVHRSGIWMKILRITINQNQKVNKLHLRITQKS